MTIWTTKKEHRSSWIGAVEYIDAHLAFDVVRNIGELRECYHSGPERHVVEFCFLRIAECCHYRGRASDRHGNCVLFPDHPGDNISLVLNPMAPMNAHRLCGNHHSFCGRIIIRLLS